jgi:hypothetical protein
MERRQFTREFKLEAVKLVRDRGVTVAQASRDLGLRRACHANIFDNLLKSAVGLSNNRPISNPIDAEFKSRSPSVEIEPVRAGRSPAS